MLITYGQEVDKGGMYKHNGLVAARRLHACLMATCIVTMLWQQVNGIQQDSKEDRNGLPAERAAFIASFESKEATSEFCLCSKYKAEKVGG